MFSIDSLVVILCNLVCDNWVYQFSMVARIGQGQILAVKLLSSDLSIAVDLGVFCFCSLFPQKKGAKSTKNAPPILRVVAKAAVVLQAVAHGDSRQASLQGSLCVPGDGGV